VTTSVLSSFVIILAVVAAAPIISDLLKRWVDIPSVVIEIAGGIVVGPALHWVHVGDLIEFLSTMGLATLMFLAGLEIDLPRIKGSPLNRALTGWGASLVIGIAVGVSLAGVDGAQSGLIVGLAITTTALGTLLPILRDNGTLATGFGTHVLAGATVGEIGPVIAITVLLGTDRPARTVVVLAIFVAVVLVASLIALRDRNKRLSRLIEDTLTTSGQVEVRIVVLFLAFMVWTADRLGLDILLGAFAAGMVFRLFSAGASEREAELVEAKLHGLGFGFLIPIFFVVSGVQFDLDSVVDDPLILVLVPALLLAFFVIRGAPTALLHRELDTPRRLALACYLATELPLVVVVTAIGVKTGRLSSSTAAALVAAALVSVLLFPLLAERARGRTASASADVPPPEPA
jgi:Kef-type K+ transport system membrane component KefB